MASAIPAPAQSINDSAWTPCSNADFSRFCVSKDERIKSAIDLTWMVSVYRRSRARNKTRLGNSHGEEFEHFREGRSPCRPIFLLPTGDQMISRTARKPSSPRVIAQVTSRVFQKLPTVCPPRHADRSPHRLRRFARLRLIYSR